VTKHSKSQPKAKSLTVSSEPRKTKRGSRKESVATSGFSEGGPSQQASLQADRSEGRLCKDSVARPSAPKQASRHKSISASDAPGQALRKERLSTLTAPKKAPHKDSASRSAGRFTIGPDLGDRCNTFCVPGDDGAVVAEGKVKTMSGSARPAVRKPCAGTGRLKKLAPTLVGSTV
jgi:hypothetical protein